MQQGSGGGGPSSEGAAGGGPQGANMSDDDDPGGGDFGLHSLSLDLSLKCNRFDDDLRHITAWPPPQGSPCSLALGGCKTASHRVPFCHCSHSCMTAGDKVTAAL